MTIAGGIAEHRRATFDRTRQEAGDADLAVLLGSSRAGLTIGVSDLVEEVLESLNGHGGAAAHVPCQPVTRLTRPSLPRARWPGSASRPETPDLRWRACRPWR